MTLLEVAIKRQEEARQKFYEVASNRISNDSMVAQAADDWTLAIEEVRRLKKN